MSVTQNGTLGSGSKQCEVHKISSHRRTLPNNGLQRTALRAAAEAERYPDESARFAVMESTLPPLPRSNGRLVDRSTQLWVRMTGQAVSWSDHPWIEGPVGDTDVIGTDFFRRYAERRAWTTISEGAPRGLIDDFDSIGGPTFDPSRVAPRVARFYEATSDYLLDVWSEWSGAFRPFGWLLAALFSRRLQQLNVPISSLDTRLGITSDVVRLLTAEGACAGAAWIRETVATRRALYVGSYSTCRVPGNAGPCLKVAFPLPNGYALVIMKPEVHNDGSLTIRSTGQRFGDPGFYFYVESSPGRGWTRYVRAMRESIHVYLDEANELRADHDLRLFSHTFLRLHYRMRDRAAG